jgi:DNA-directed RNA polymerase beta' subunit
MVDRGKTEVWDALMSSSRSIRCSKPCSYAAQAWLQAFVPVLVEGRALSCTPWSCTAYNADFDATRWLFTFPLG